MQCVFLGAGAGSCETCDTLPDLAGPRHKALDTFRFGVMVFLISLSLLPWMTAVFTRMEQEEENWLILVIAPICFSAVVNNFESAAENRPVNQCPIQILNLPVTQAAQQTATHRRRHLRKLLWLYFAKCKYFNSSHDYLAGNKGRGLDLKMNRVWLLMEPFMYPGASVFTYVDLVLKHLHFWRRTLPQKLREWY